MSYAYIKNVYPDFQANKVYDDKIYNSLNSGTGQDSTPSIKSNIPVPFDEEARFARNLLAKSEIQLPQFNLLETLQNTTPDTTHKPIKDNLRYYNIPIPKVVETFEEPRQQQQQECQVDCESHIQHVLNCTRCKGIISKQLNLDNDRVKNEEFMELFSYIIFGVFILLLIESMKNAE